MHQLQDPVISATGYPLEPSDFQEALTRYFPEVRPSGDLV